MEYTKKNRELLAEIVAGEMSQEDHYHAAMEMLERQYRDSITVFYYDCAEHINIIKEVTQDD